MHFAENLKQLRKEKGLSQEELAERMGVSRQAVSKWEQGEIYPEVEKLLLLAKQFQVSLDALMSGESSDVSPHPRQPKAEKILLTSPHENVIVECSKVVSSQRMHGGKHAPQYALFCVGSGGNPTWGEPTTFLGWYANQEQLSKEIQEIHQALEQNIPSYTLKYSAKVQRKWMHLTLVEDP